MRKLSVFTIVVGLLGVGVVGGCSSPPSRDREPRGVAGTAKSTAPTSVATSKAARFNAVNNPTTLAGRGEPSLDERARPAAWVFIDGKAGKFTDRDGEPLTQWIVEGPVSSSPTFRVEGYEPLLGSPRDFKCVLQAVDSSEGSTAVYGIAAKEGTFTPGHDYPLLHPGENFVIRNGLTGDVVTEIAPLAPGAYAIVGGLENRATGKRALAVSYFTIGEDR